MKQFVVLLLLLQSCISIEDKPADRELPGDYYRIRQGDTLELLSRRHHVSIDEIMETNGISDPKALRIGQAIFLPDPDPIGAKIATLYQQRKPAPPSPSPARSSSEIHRVPKEVGSTSSKILDFPLPGGTIFREFSRQKLNPYDGVGIKAGRTDVIIAALDGKVIFVGDDGSKFGLIVILEHEKNLITVYTHLKNALVKTGQQLSRKMPLGVVGTSGGVSTPRLHFQVRENQRPKNPRWYLRDV